MAAIKHGAVRKRAELIDHLHSQVTYLVTPTNKDYLKQKIKTNYNIPKFSDEAKKNEFIDAKNALNIWEKLKAHNNPRATAEKLKQVRARYLELCKELHIEPTL